MNENRYFLFKHNLTNRIMESLFTSSNQMMAKLTLLILFQNKSELDIEEKAEQLFSLRRN